MQFGYYCWYILAPHYRLLSNNYESLCLVRRTAAAPQSPCLHDPSVKTVSVDGRVRAWTIALSRSVMMMLGWISRSQGGRAHGVMVSTGAVFSGTMRLP